MPRQGADLFLPTIAFMCHSSVNRKKLKKPTERVVGLAVEAQVRHTSLALAQDRVGAALSTLSA